MMKRATLIAAIVLLNACGSSSPSRPTEVTPALQAVVFSFADLSSLRQAGSTAQVTALGVFSNNTMRDITTSCTSWRSDDVTVLAVSNSGVLTAQRSSGTANISTVCQGVGASGLITINPPFSFPPPSSPPSSGACPRPPYSVTIDYDGQRHCREENGRFADNVCCGI